MKRNNLVDNRVVFEKLISNAIPSVRWDKTPYTLLRSRNYACLGESSRLAIVLFTLYAYPQTKAYKLAFRPQCSSRSLATMASRFFAREEIQDLCRFFAFYYDGYGYHVLQRYRQYEDEDYRG